jgi:hypothetical protein
MDVNAAHPKEATILANRASPESLPRSTTSLGRQNAGLVTTALLVLQAFASLILFDVLAWSGYKRVYAFTRTRRVAGRRPSLETTARVCWAVQEACVWYVKRVYCLQRSSATAWMLRRGGVPAELVIGYRPVPLDSHAWVEVAGQVVNDLPQYQRAYKELDRL